jgi:hypothetical protein
MTTYHVDTEGKPIENDALSNTNLISPINNPSRTFDIRDKQLDNHNNQDLLQLQFSMPLKDILSPLLELEVWNEEIIWFDVVFDKRIFHVISAIVGQKSQRNYGQEIAGIHRV